MAKEISLATLEALAIQAEDVRRVLIAELKARHGKDPSLPGAVAIMESFAHCELTVVLRWGQTVDGFLVIAHLLKHKLNTMTLEKNLKAMKLCVLELARLSELTPIGANPETVLKRIDASWTGAKPKL